MDGDSKKVFPQPGGPPANAEVGGSALSPCTLSVTRGTEISHGISKPSRVRGGTTSCAELKQTRLGTGRVPPARAHNYEETYMYDLDGKKPLVVKQGCRGKKRRVRLSRFVGK